MGEETGERPNARVVEPRLRVLGDRLPRHQKPQRILIDGERVDPPIWRLS
jgi:hypothetical protein